MPQWTWDIDLRNLYGKKIKVETKDGVYLEGVLSGVEKVLFEFDGVLVGNLHSLEMDNDREKVVDVSRIKKVEILD